MEKEEEKEEEEEEGEEEVLPGEGLAGVVVEVFEEDFVTCGTSLAGSIK